MEKSELKKISYYKSVLKKYKYIADFYTCEQNIEKNIEKDLEYKDSVIYRTSIMVTAPVLISYIIFVLKDSQKRGIKDLYFLSRDGYIMYKIAKVLCDYYRLDVNCKYIYISRFVLRSSLYLIDKDEAMKHFCETGAEISARVVLQRAGIEEVDQNEVFNQLNIQMKNNPLTDEQLLELKEKLEGNSYFREKALIYAKENYKLIYNYFLQEGLIEKNKYAIVDVGWMGSMQRHIMQILKYAGKNIDLHGYYFAMFENVKIDYGEYHCFYFSKDSNSLRRVLFNNNLFECLCSANHGMTIGYKKVKDGLIIPILKDYEAKWNVDLQLKVVEKFVSEFVNENRWEEIKKEKLYKIVKKLLVSFMIFPSLSEATTYGSIPFCDDVTESYMRNLASLLNKYELYRYTIIYKTYVRLYKKKENEKFNESFWINGTIQLSDIKFKKLFNIGCVINEYIHYLIIRKV